MLAQSSESTVESVKQEASIYQGETSTPTLRSVTDTQVVQNCLEKFFDSINQCVGLFSHPSLSASLCHLPGPGQNC